MSQQRTNHLTCFTHPLPRSSECACAEYDRGEGRKASVRGEFTGGDDDVTDLKEAAGTPEETVRTWSWLWI